VKDVIKLVAGAQHILALTSNGAVFSWGNNEQNQLGRRMINRYHDHPWLVPGQCSLPRGITDVGAGTYHSFAIHKSGQLYAWGSNNFGQTGIFQSAGQSDAVILYPTPVPSLGKGSGILSVTGGKDHSLAINKKGQCLTWGRIDNKALGIVAKDIPTHDVIVDTYGKPRILKVPTPISGVDGKVVFTAAGTDHSFAITQDGKAYRWGFNAHITLDTGMRKRTRSSSQQNSKTNMCLARCSSRPPPAVSSAFLWVYMILKRTVYIDVCRRLSRER
jgi:regulator of chromosome condensation